MRSSAENLPLGPARHVEIRAERLTPEPGATASKSDDCTVQIVFVGALDAFGCDLPYAQRAATFHVHGSIDLRRIPARASLCSHHARACPRTLAGCDFVDDHRLPAAD